MERWWKQTYFTDEKKPSALWLGNLGYWKLLWIIQATVIYSDSSKEQRTYKVNRKRWLDLTKASSTLKKTSQPTILLAQHLVHLWPKHIAGEQADWSRRALRSFRRENWVWISRRSCPWACQDQGIQPLRKQLWYNDTWIEGLQLMHSYLSEMYLDKSQGGGDTEECNYTNGVIFLLLHHFLNHHHHSHNFDKITFASLFSTMMMWIDTRWNMARQSTHGKLGTKRSLYMKRFAY